MFNIALGLFVVAAVFGLYMASRIFRGALPPWGAAIAHGVLAASGLLVLLYALYTGVSNATLMAAAGLLVVAALGGFVLVSFHLRKAAPPKALVVVHALAAVFGVACLLGNAFGMI